MQRLDSSDTQSLSMYDKRTRRRDAQQTRGQQGERARERVGGRRGMREGERARRREVKGHEVKKAQM